MKISDLLRALADQVDGAQSDPVIGKAIQHIDSVEDDPADEGSKFLPPLQAKLELLKKSEDVPSVYDDQEDNEAINIIRKNAGMKPRSRFHNAADDDGPFEE